VNQARETSDIGRDFPGVKAIVIIERYIRTTERPKLKLVALSDWTAW
jgi:hypothetical protein